jgi:hypothetical protein
MHLSLTEKQAEAAGKIAAALLDELVEGAPGEGAYVLDTAVEDCGCRGVCEIEVADRDAALLLSALSAYEQRVGGALSDREAEAIRALRGAIAASRATNVASLAGRRRVAPQGSAA